MLGLNSSFAPGGEEPLQTLVFEVYDHWPSVTYMVTGYKMAQRSGSGAAFFDVACSR